MLKLILIIGIVVVAYRLGKSVKGHHFFSEKPVGEKDIEKINDIMVKDPYCNTYFPKKDGICLKMNGQNLYFCSTECRDKYIALQSKP